MKTWYRSEFEFTCGFCGARMPAGSPLFAVTLSNVKHPRLRCVTCAWEPQPPIIAVGLPVPVGLTHLDADGLERPGPAPMTPLRAAMAALDYKAQASGS